MRRRRRSASRGGCTSTFGSPGTAAIDARTGKVLWERRDLECNHYRGAGSSPILFRNLLIMHFDGSDVQYVVALDKNTGKTVWKTPRSIDFKDLEPDGKPKAEGDFRKAFSTPHIVDGRGSAAADQPRRQSDVRLRSDDRQGVLASRGPQQPYRRHPPGRRPRPDLLSDRLGELEAARRQPEGRGDVTATNVVWQFTRGIPNKPSILLVDDLIFMVNDAGIASCIEAKTGTLVWQQRIGGRSRPRRCPPAGAIYLFDEDGKTTVLAAGREFKVLAENQLDNGFMASAAVAGNALFLRTTKDVYRIEEAP